MRSSCKSLLSIGALLLLSNRGAAQVLTPSRVRIDTVIGPPMPSLLPQRLDSTAKICLDCHAFGRSQGSKPAMIIEDPAAHVLAMFPPGDSQPSASPNSPEIGPESISKVRIVRDSFLLRLLGPAFNSGVVIVTLTPAGAAMWRSFPPRRVP